MHTTPYSLPPAPELLRLFAGYAQWMQALSTAKPDWQADDLTVESLQQIQPDFGGTSPADLIVYQTHISGLNWKGEAFDRPAYLCLCEAEARMVTNEVQQPSRERSRLYFSRWANVRVEAVSLPAVLATLEGRKHLRERLESLLIYAQEVYLWADSLCFWMRNGAIGQWLFRNNSLMVQLDEEETILDRLPKERPSKVWSPEGLGGLLAVGSKFPLPCHYAYLSSPQSGLIEARKDPLPPVTPPVKHFDFMQFTCDIVDYRSGQQVNPPGVVALQNSLCVMSDRFVACMKDVDIAQPRMGFMNKSSEWLGRSDWADVLLFNEYLAAVQCPDTRLWGFIDRHGNIAIPPRYAIGSFFNDGVAIVSLPKESAAEGPRWALINTQGDEISGPWHDIEHGRGDTYQVRDGAGRWGLVNQRGAMLVEPMTIDQGVSEDERTNILSTQFKEQRRSIVTDRLANLPLAQAVAGLGIRGERDFYECGLWWKKVNVLRVPAHWQDTFGPTTQGRIGWNYPVSANLFNFEKECPVLLERESGDPLSLGIPWVDLELLL